MRDKKSHLRANNAFELGEARRRRMFRITAGPAGPIIISRRRGDGPESCPAKTCLAENSEDRRRHFGLTNHEASPSACFRSLLQVSRKARPLHAAKGAIHSFFFFFFLFFLLTSPFYPFYPTAFTQQ